MFMPPSKSEKLQPVDGWLPSSWYLIEVSMSRTNPIFRALLYTGFLQDGQPGGYSKIVGPSHDDFSYRRPHYLKPLALILQDMKPVNEPITIWK